MQTDRLERSAQRALLPRPPAGSAPVHKSASCERACLPRLKSIRGMLHRGLTAELITLSSLNLSALARCASTRSSAFQTISLCDSTLCYPPGAGLRIGQFKQNKTAAISPCCQALPVYVWKGMCLPQPVAVPLLLPCPSSRTRRVPPPLHQMQTPVEALQRGLAVCLRRETRARTRRAHLQEASTPRTAAKRASPTYGGPGLLCSTHLHTYSGALPGSSLLTCNTLLHRQKKRRSSYS